MPTFNQLIKKPRKNKKHKILKIYTNRFEKLYSNREEGKNLLKKESFFINKDKFNNEFINLRKFL